MAGDLEMNKNRNIMILISAISGLIINVIYRFLLRPYDQWTKEQLSMISALVICVILIMCFWKRDDKKGVFLRFVVMIVVSGVGIGLRVDKDFIKVFILNLSISLVIMWINKNGINIMNVILSLSTVILGLALSCMFLNQKSIQDYKSHYEISRIPSQNKKYEAIVSMYDRDSDNYIVMVSITDEKKSKNIYVSKQKDLDVDLQWMGENEIRIQGQKINVEKDICDDR